MNNTILLDRSATDIWAMDWEEQGPVFPEESLDDTYFLDGMEDDRDEQLLRCRCGCWEIDE